ncbi:Hypothetical predicted protein [Cloeon dipterum]|uniref:AP-5 complex subunit beta-1 n=2 Tax=Cloeon dipterum TaxID=197152 RepID=A0A8S1DC81_9INSE|nr:Hypothetical predicted protein [Cloeon dipterum]
MVERSFKSLLKSILSDRIDETEKLELLFQLEGADLDVEEVRVALEVLQRVQNTAVPLKDPLHLVRSQALQTATTLLLTCHAKFAADTSCKRLMLKHTDLLLSYCNGNNDMLKSVASICLTEIQLYNEELIGASVAVVDTLAAFETSVAHQPLLQFLSLLATEKQTAAFLMAQLPLLSTPAVAFVSSRLANLASPYLTQAFLKPLLATFSLTAVTAAVRLAGFLDAFDRMLLFKRIVALSNHPGLPAASRLVLLDVASHVGSTFNLLTPTTPEISFADGAHSKFKKIAAVLAGPCGQGVEAAVEDASSTDYKAVNAKVLYLASKHEQLHDVCKRQALRLMLDDLSFAPHLLELVQIVPELDLPNLIPSILERTPPEPRDLPFFVMLLRQAVASRSSAVARPKESLALIKTIVREGLPADEAHLLLSTCHQIIKVFDPADFVEEMKGLLSAVAASSAEEDVVARVASFESLLSCLTDANVRQVLRQQKRELEPGFFHKAQSVTLVDQPALSLRVKRMILPEKISTESLEEYLTLIKSRKYAKIEFEILAASAGNGLEAVAVFFEPSTLIEPLLLGRVSNEKTSTTVYNPEKPYPAQFQVRAEFKQNGRMCCCSLPSWKIDLTQILQPLPCKERKEMAEMLWNQVSDWPQSCVVLGTEAANARFSDLRPFAVDEELVATFLAPSSHLLFRFSARKVEIKTDDVILLAYANDFLCS